MCGSQQVTLASSRYARHYIGDEENGWVTDKLDMQMVLLKTVMEESLKSTAKTTNHDDSTCVNHPVVKRIDCCLCYSAALVSHAIIVMLSITAVMPYTSRSSFQWGPSEPGALSQTWIYLKRSMDK